MFSEKDLEQIQSRGSNLENVQQQIRSFESGFPSLRIAKAATIGEGIIRLDEPMVDFHSQAFEALLADLEVIKFVPASGAASRMFKSLFAFKDSYNPSRSEHEEFLKSKTPADVYQFFEQLDKFAFYEDLASAASGEDLLKATVEGGNFGSVLRLLLDEIGLDYGNLPKGLLKFHSYKEGARTPAEEHLVEGANYAKDKEGQVRLHFTVSPEHQEKFETLIQDVRAFYEGRFNARFDVSYSQQMAATDTIAVDLENQPFRESDGSLLFRPGGHGALLANLDQIDGDIIFIKNIDNVVPDHLKDETYRYKKALAGLLMGYRNQVFDYLLALEQNPSADLLQEISQYVQEQLCVLPPEGFQNYHEDQIKDYLKGKLNRPIRVCGMVKNEGEPGGGPFWAYNSDGSISLQIAESAQIDFSDPDQKKIAEGATHFNPVDLICSTRDRYGETFSLMKYRDPQTGFISQKSKDGRELKAQELPGLWNGAMSDWNTLFVEVPIVTFNPVKTVNDLLRPQHQGLQER